MSFNESLFWQKVEKTESCWLWSGYLNADGYGEFRSKFLTTRLAHRIAYGLDKGELPNMPLDHLCRHRHCVNPDHLEPISVEANTRRGSSGTEQSSRTECPQGHPYNEENTIRQGNKRKCRACHNQRNRELRARKKAEREQT